MQFLRKTGLVLCASLFFTVLLWFSILFGVERVMGSPKPLQDALKTSGIYKTVIGDALNQAAKDQKDQDTTSDTKEIPVSQAEVRKVISDAFPPEYLQTQTETVITSVYAWLDGATPNLSFAIDLNDAKARLANGVSSYVTQRLANMPACTAANMPTSVDDVDPFNATCLPPGFDKAAAAQKMHDQIQTGKFLEKTSFTASDMKDDQGRPVSEQFNKVPSYYQKAKKGIYFLGLLAVLLGTAVVFLSINKRAGLHKVAVTATTVGVSLTLFGIATGIALTKAFEKLSETKDGGQPLQQTLFQGGRLLANDMRAWWIALGVILLVLGIGGLVALHFTKPKETKTSPAAKPGPEAGETPKPDQPAKPAPKPKATQTSKK